MVVLVRLDGDPSLGAMAGMKMANTDDEGRFDLESLEPGRYGLVSGTMGSEDFGIGTEIVIEGGGVIERDVPLPAGVLAGTVVSAADGKPVEGARIGVFDPTAAERPLRTLTDLLSVLRAQGGSGADGKFELTEVRPGRAIVQVHADGFAPKLIEDVVIGEGGGAALRVPLERGLEVTVHASAREVTNLEGAAVFVFDGAGRRLVTTGDLSPTTGPDGSLALRLVAGRYRLQVQADGYAPYLGDFEAGGAAKVEARLVRGGAVRLLVTDGSGPVAGADCRIFRADGREVARLATEDTLMAGASTTTDEEGALTLEHLPAGDLRIRATARDGRTAETTVKVTEAAETAATLSFEK
jgi:hypothetical protein